MAKDRTEWNSRYEKGDLPWDSNIRSRELARVIDEIPIAPCRAVELGCGTGTNALFLAEQGFSVTAFDISSVATQQATLRANEAGLHVDFISDDLCSLEWTGEPFDFIFDRGCYHCAREESVEGLQAALATLSKPGTRYLSLIGNTTERNGNEPAMTEEEIRTEYGRLFDIDELRPVYLEDAGGAKGPLAWSCLMTRPRSITNS